MEVDKIRGKNGKGTNTQWLLSFCSLPDSLVSAAEKCTGSMGRRSYKELQDMEKDTRYMIILLKAWSI